MNLYLFSSFLVANMSKVKKWRRESSKGRELKNYIASPNQLSKSELGNGRQWIGKACRTKKSTNTNTCVCMKQITDIFIKSKNYTHVYACLERMYVEKKMHWGLEMRGSAIKRDVYEKPELTGTISFSVSLFLEIRENRERERERDFAASRTGQRIREKKRSKREEDEEEEEEGDEEKEKEEGKSSAAVPWHLGRCLSSFGIRKIISCPDLCSGYFVNCPPPPLFTPILHVCLLLAKSLPLFIFSLAIDFRLLVKKLRDVPTKKTFFVFSNIFFLPLPIFRDQLQFFDHEKWICKLNNFFHLLAKAELF